MKTKKKIVIVTTDIMGPVRSGGVGTSCYLLAKSLAQSGHQVQVLFSAAHSEWGHNFTYWQYYYREFGVALDKVDPSPIHMQHGSFQARAAMTVYLQLRQTDPDLIIFPEMHGLGHYCLLAKKSGLEFQKTQLWVMFHGPSAWHMEGNGGLPTGLMELTAQAMEKESCVNADLLLFATEHAKKVALEMGFLKVGQPHQVLIFPFESGPSRTKSNSKKIKEICFFGRLETRKGLVDFLDAIHSIRSEIETKRVKISLLGSYGLVGRTGSMEYIQSWIAKNKIFVDVMEDKNREECLKYLSESGAMVVLPSLSETMGYTLIECLQNQIPFLCSDIEPFCELLKFFGARNHPTFAVGDSVALARAIRSRLRRGHKSTSCRSDAARETLKKWNRLVSSVKATKVAHSRAERPVEISLCIPHRNRPHFLQEILHSIEGMSRPPKEVLVYDDGSTVQNLKALKRIIGNFKRVPTKIILGRQRLGPSAVRNSLAEAALGEYLFFLDDDNIPIPTLFSDLSIIIHRQQPDFVVSSFERFFSGKARGQPDMWFPVTGDLSANFFYNMIGDANCCVRKAFYRQIGGFCPELNSAEDWEFFVRAVSAGGRMTLCPKPLIRYRVHDSNASLKHYPARNLALLHERYSGVLFHPEFKGLMQLFTAWAGERENILVKGVPFAEKLVIPNRLPVLKLMASDRRNMQLLANACLGKSEINEFALKITTQKTFRKGLRPGQRSQVFKIMLLSPRYLGLQLNPEEPALQIRPGINLMDLRLPKNGGFNPVSSDVDVELFIIQARKEGFE